MSRPDDHDLRAALVAGMQRLERLGLNRGTAGNLSVRTPQGFLVTPSGVAPGELLPEAMVAMDADGAHPADGPRPSSEWRFHKDIYRERADAGAVVHVHSTHATALACQRRGVPAFHYMVAVAGGPDIRCAPYATFGTQALSDAAVSALEGRRACLLANHGMITLGASVDAAIALAIEVESLAEQFLAAALGGEPVLLGEAEMAEVIERFRSYGARHD